MSLDSDIDKIVNPVLATFSGPLAAELEKALVSIYISGTAQMTEWAGVAFEGPPMAEAVKFARERGSTLVKQINETTRERLRNTIADGINNKRGVPGIARDIRKTFDGMTKYRSELIARTETANGLGEAFIARGKELGVTGKEWLTVGDDRVSIECQENEMAGVIPFDSAFPSGVMTVPQHPACRCAVAPVMR